MRRDRPSTDARREQSGTAYAIASLCLTLSGAAGLIAEVCWIRRAALAFGSTLDAFSTVLAVFFLGLALGGVCFGEWSQRSARPLRAYALLEIALAVLILATAPLFNIAESLYGALYRADPAAPALHAARAALIGLVVLAPALLMGGTLPLICRQFVARAAGVGSDVAFLYAVNTLGAAAGALLCGFVLLPSLGMRLALLVAAALDLLAGLLAAAIGWRQRAPIADVSAPSPVGRRSLDPPRALPAVALLFFCTGFVALGNEVLWTRFMALLTPSTVLTYTITLAVVLVGIVVGTVAIAPVADRTGTRARLFGALQVANGLSGLAVLLLPPGVWQSASAWWTHALLLLLPAAFSGAAFPLAVRMVVSDPRLAGAGVGRMAAANTLGGIAGALLVGFVSLPRLGLQNSLLVTTGVSVAAGCATWWWLERSARVGRRAIAIAVCVGAWLALPRLLATHIPQDLLAAPHELVDYREGREANLAVISRQGTLQLEADRWWQGQDRKTHQVLAAHVPLLLHPAPRRVLVVGVGAGQTPASALTHSIERLDCVDIEPAVFDLVRARFDHAWMDDPRVHLLREDGRSYLAHTAARYDVIALEVGQPSRPGVANFYSADFYALARQRLEPGGILSQFVPLPFLTPDSFRSVVATFLSVFPHSILWYNSAELLLLGVNGDHIELAMDRLGLLASQAAVNADLRFAHWGGPAHWLNQPAIFLAGFLVGPQGLAALAAGAPIERDDRPQLAYAARRAAAGDLNELVVLESLRPQVAPIASVLRGPAPDDLVTAAAQERERNLADIAASAHLRQAEALAASASDADLAAMLAAALAENPDNVRVHRLLGDLAARQQRSGDAQTRYRAALALDPDDASAHLGLAKLLLLQGRMADAVAHYQAALAQRPNDPQAHNDYAAALFQQRDFDGAERELRIALRLSPAYPQARENLAQLRNARAKQ
jgi:spermidine synthase